MGIAPLPTPLERLGNRGFSFHPPIVRADRNEWLFRRATWSEMLVANAYSGREMWIPRRFIGEVSGIGEYRPVVFLLKELEYRDDAVWPHRTRVIQMPRPAAAEEAAAARTNPAEVVPISLHATEASAKGRMIVGAVVIGALAVAGVLAESQVHSRRTALRDISYRDLRVGDDANLVERILGPSAEQDWNAEAGRLELAYPRRGYTVVLTGPSQGEARYTGVVPFPFGAR